MENNNSPQNKVSVIIPVYNAERYLSRCLDSVCGQSYDNLQILVVNDGSTDCSLEICNKYSEQDSRIKVISKSNEGQGKARNIGLDLAEGDYIVFVDSDDAINYKMIETMLSFICKYDADMVQCAYQEVDESCEIDWNEDIDSTFLKISIDDNPRERILCYYTGDIVPWNKMFRRDLIGELRFPEGIFYEDKHLMFRLRYFAKKIVCLDSELYYYVQSNNSTMRNKLDEKRLKSSFNVIEELLAFCKKYQLEDNYQSELSGDFRKLLSIFFATYKNKEYSEYNARAKQMLIMYMPELKSNPYVQGKDKMLLTILSLNVSMLVPLYYLNKIRKRV